MRNISNPDIDDETLLGPLPLPTQPQETVDTQSGRDHQAPSPLFIVGYIHTGTSLLQTILGHAPELIILKGETHFIQDLRPIKREFPDLEDPVIRHEFTLYLVKLAHIGFNKANWYRDQYSLADLNITNEQYEAIVARVDEVLAVTPPNDRHKVAFGVVMDCLAELAGKSRWLEKTPQHVFFLDTVFDLWPEARVINLIRDPRAAIASRKVRRADEWMQRRIAANPLGTDQHTNFDPLIDSHLWKSSVAAGLEAEQRHPGKVLTVRYEDLVAEPERIVKQICDFTGLTYSPAMLEIGWINSATHTKGEKSQGISKAAVDKWRTILTPEEVFVSQQAVRKEMKAFGYEPASVGLVAIAKSPLVLGASAAHLFARLWNQPERLQHRRTDATRRIYQRALKSLGIR